MSQSPVDPPARNDPPEPTAQPELKDDSRPMTYRSRDLLQGWTEAWIEHNGEMYRLRVTPSGKLYLTK